MKRKLAKIGKFLVVIICIMLISIQGIVPAYASEDDHRSLGDLLTQFINRITERLKNNLSDMGDFLKQFAEYKEELESSLPQMFFQLCRIINEYATSQSGFIGGFNEMFSSLYQLTGGLWNLILKFPMLDKVIEIVGPIVDHFIEVVKSNLPEIHFQDEKVPYGAYGQFYDDMAEQDPYGMGTVFEIERNPTSEGCREKSDRVQETTQNGNHKENILRREIRETQDGLLVYYLLIMNNVVIKEFAKREDLSVYHGMLDDMRHDGVNPSIIAFVREHLKLINYYLVKAHNDMGLVIDMDHPQLWFPSGYNPKRFIRNLTRILRNWQNKTYNGLKTLEQKFKGLEQKALLSIDKTVLGSARP